MTKLLATIRSTEAVDYARNLAVRMHEHGSIEGFGSPFGAAESRAFWRRMLRMLTVTTDGRMSLIELARRGEEEAAAVLAELLLEIDASNWPPELQTYSKEVVRDRQHGHRPPGVAHQQ